MVYSERLVIRHIKSLKCPIFKIRPAKLVTTVPKGEGRKLKITEGKESTLPMRPLCWVLKRTLLLGIILLYNRKLLIT